MNVAIIIPIYKFNLSEAELVSIYRAKLIYSKRDIYFLLPNKFKNFKFDFISEINENIIYVADYYLSGIIGYNRLLFDINFYKKFINFSYILICQIDVFVFKDDLDFWMSKNYSNIGAPILDLKFHDIKYKKGNNGGFCLRSVNCCISILSKKKIQFCTLGALWKCENTVIMKIYRVIYNGLIFNYRKKPFLPVLNEDIFWSAIVPSMYSCFKIPTLNESIKFAFDSNPRYFFYLNNNQIPSAIHAWGKYDIEFVQRLIDNLE